MKLFYKTSIDENYTYKKDELLNLLGNFLLEKFKLRPIMIQFI